MKDRYILVVIALSVIITSSWAAGQQPAAAGTVGGCPTEPLAFHLCALDKAKTFNPPRTPSGKPNLQGHYRARLAQSYSFEGVSGSEPQFGAKIMPWSLSPPMIVDPPDRKIPYQPWAAGRLRSAESVRTTTSTSTRAQGARRPAYRVSFSRTPIRSYSHRPTITSCGSSKTITCSALLT